MMQVKICRNLFLRGFFLLGACILITGQSSASIIRHDRTDVNYTDLAAESQYDAAGSIYNNSSQTGGCGSGILIDPWWVMTAGHCLYADVPPTPVPGKGKWFTAGGQTIVWDGEELYKHPTEDIGIFKLSSPITNVTPATRWKSSYGSILGEVGTLVGYGWSGTGLTGSVIPSGTRRAIQNVIDTNHSWYTNCVRADFDSPDGTSSSMGSSTPLKLEGMGAGGDSGAGIFITRKDEAQLAAIHLGGWNDTDLYGDINRWLQVSPYNSWVDNIMGGGDAADVPEPSTFVMLIAGLIGLLVVRRRSK